MTSWKKIGAYLGIIGGLIFVIVTIIAMFTYPGGYSFLDNYFSELGLTETNGQPSMLNYALFSIACTSVAICLIPFMLTIRTEFQETTTLKVLSGVGTILGIASAPNLSALALFAADIYPTEHGTFTLLFFLLITLGIFAYSIAILLNTSYLNLYALFGFIAVIICFLLIGAFFSPIFAFFGSALWQKVSVYALVLWSVFQGYYLLKKFE
jgi:hypothetical protein